MITLVAIVCHMLGTVPAPLCVEEIVTDSPFEAQARKIDAPIPMPALTMAVCESHGQEIAAVWLAQHPIYHTWFLHKWECVPGRYSPPHAT
jgi:hypothetical protein